MDDLVFVPALVVVLMHEEREAGRDLTQNEVENIRDNAVCMAVPVEAAFDLEEGRGYADITPENVWKDWLAFKAEG